VSADVEYPLISAVVIGRNEGARLVRCLEALRAADYPQDKLEIIYVDTASTDSSVAEAERLGARVVRLNPERPSAALARNAGWQVAGGEFIHVFDGDTVVDPAWLKIAVAAFADPRVVGVSGQRRELEPSATVYNFWTDQDWISPAGECDVVGGDAMFRRADLERVGGYDASLIAGEERDLSYRLLEATGGVMICRPERMTWHDINMTRFGQYWKRCVRSGWAYAEVGSRYAKLRRWRRIVQRNLLKAAVLVVLVAAAIVLRRGWLAAIGFALIGLSWLRAAWRNRQQAGSPGRAMLYAVHLVISKVPVCVGHVQYFWQRARGSAPRRLIEYRGEAPVGGGSKVEGPRSKVSKPSSSAGAVEA
jgi:cellulose synthase/poly-beta-1,6-N-acetylglucosamine synthase-like glycosyltransferase